MYSTVESLSLFPNSKKPVWSWPRVFFSQRSWQKVCFSWMMCFSEILRLLQVARNFFLRFYLIYSTAFISIFWSISTLTLIRISTLAPSLRWHSVPSYLTIWTIWPRVYWPRSSTLTYMEHTLVIVSGFMVIAMARASYMVGAVTPCNFVLMTSVLCLRMSRTKRPLVVFVDVHLSYQSWGDNGGNRDEIEQKWTKTILL